MSRGRPDRIPTMPQICHPHAVAMLYDDYREGMAEVVENPGKALDLVLEAARRYDVDGLRLFTPTESFKVVDDGEVMLALDPETGERVGRVDVLGGGAVVADKPSHAAETADDVNAIPVPGCADLLETMPFVTLAQAVEKAHDEGFFVASSPGPFTVNFLALQRGREQALVDLIANAQLASRIMEVGLEIAIERAQALVACDIDALYIGDPSAGASVISPRHFEEFCLPRFRAFCDELHKRSVLIYIHVCGNAQPLLEMLADTGADCVEPLDPLGNVSVADAKRRIGARVSLMGGVNTLTLLHGSPESVYQEALVCCQAGGADGGYILAAGDMVPDFTPQENVLALVQAAKDFRTCSRSG